MEVNLDYGFITDDQQTVAGGILRKVFTDAVDPVL